MKKVTHNFIPILIVLFFFSCSSHQEKTIEKKQTSHITKDDKIVSLSGTITEILCLTGFESSIVGIDITSTFPERINKLPTVGHTQNIQAEGIISLNPSIVIGNEEELKPELLEQLKAAGIEVILCKQDYSVQGTKNLIIFLTTKLNRKEIGKQLIQKLDINLSKLKQLNPKPKVLFIYARGVGTLMVAGEETQMEKIIRLAGAKNAAKGFKGFKPLTPEALVEANPDIILMFSSGLESLEGEKGLTNIPGLTETNAGRNNAIIAMDGQYLSGFGPRLGEAINELNTKINRLNAKK